MKKQQKMASLEDHRESEDVIKERERQYMERMKNMSPEEWSEHMMEMLDGWRNVTINIGVVGQSRQGKSSLVNALMGLFMDDDGNLPPHAAEIDESKVCTKEPQPFRHPGNKNIFLWDLPGVDGTDHTLESYLRVIGVSNKKRHYDFFLTSLEPKQNLFSFCFKQASCVVPLNLVLLVTAK